jgi:hypothetical protein
MIVSLGLPMPNTSGCTEHPAGSLDWSAVTVGISGIHRNSRNSPHDSQGKSRRIPYRHRPDCHALACPHRPERLDRPAASYQTPTAQRIPTLPPSPHRRIPGAQRHHASAPDRVVLSVLRGAGGATVSIHSYWPVAAAAVSRAYSAAAVSSCANSRFQILCSKNLSPPIVSLAFFPARRRGSETSGPCKGRNWPSATSASCSPRRARLRPRRYEPPCLVGEINQARPGLEYAKRRAAIRRVVIKDRRHLVVGADLEELRRELLAHGTPAGSSPN